MEEAGEGVLSAERVREICAAFVRREGLAGRKVLAVIPDHTRSGPLHMVIGPLYDLLATGPGRFDALVALGTHPPMSEEAIDRRLGLRPGERAVRYPLLRVFNHRWQNPDALRTAGTIPAERIAELSHGMMNAPVVITVNRLAFEYDTLLIVGPVFPHEVVGFSGGNKYLFPGIAGREIIDLFHWLGALITSPVIIGTKHTPVRAVVDAAAALLPVRRLCLAMVVDGHSLAGLHAGTPEEAWSAAADQSARVHIRLHGHPYRSVLSSAPAMYDDLWVGAKAAYKLEPVVAEGGELIVHAPHIREISVTHGAMIERIGYHVRDYFLAQMDRFRDVPGGVLAHSTHVKGVGTYEGGVEKPRITVVLATGIPEAVCRRINLGYRDPATIDPADWQGKDDEGLLHVAKAGEVLHRLRNDPFRRP
jgi:nickel-dependent lactate racemase